MLRRAAPTSALLLLLSIPWLARAAQVDPPPPDDLRPAVTNRKRRLKLKLKVKRGEGPPAATTPANLQENPELLPPRGMPPRLGEKATTPWIARWMVHSRRRGMFLNIPIIDTDPNRGVTVGILPVWVIPAKDSDRIEQIHAPSFTYNRIFQFVPTYRFYYYPSPVSSFVFRTSVSVLAEKEVLALYQDKFVFGSAYDFYVRGQWNVDGSNRFYGVGPASQQSAQSVYTEDNAGWDMAVGHPVGGEGTHWRGRVLNHFMGEKFYGGKIPGLANTPDAFPGVFAPYRQVVNEMRAALEYDSRDSQVATSKGEYLNAFWGWSSNGFASAFDYSRWGLDGRWIHPWDGTKQTTAAQVKYEQLLGDAPFWLEPSLGGKYSLRAYGDGRFRDRGAGVAQVEQRCKFYEVKMSGVATEFELAPFVGLGEVFDNPKVATAKYARPAFGGAVRAIARPQVVGSVDVGVGQEGIAVFMDINYSF